MPYIKIDENRKQTASYSSYSAKSVEDVLIVDIVSPAEYYKLKIDFKDFSGEDQWEVDAEEKQNFDDNIVLDDAFAEELNNTIWTEVEKNKKGKLNARQVKEAKDKIK